VGAFFQALAIALAAAVLASLGLALTVVPLLSSALGKRTEAAPLPTGERLAAAYGRWLDRALARPRRIVAVAALLSAGALGAGFFVETDFIPELDEGAYVFDYFTPIGTSLGEADRLAGQIDDLLRADPDVATFTRRLGAELGPPRATETSRGDIVVRLKPHHRPIEEIMEDQRRLAAARLPGVRIELIQPLQDMLEDLEGNPEPIELKLFGDDEAELRAQAARVAGAIKDVRGLVDLFDGQVACSPERVVRADPIKAGRLGLTTEAIAAQLQAALLGTSATPLPARDRLLPVRVRWPDESRFDPSALERVRLRVPSGGFVPLTELARAEEACAPSEIARENLRLMVPVTARLEGRDLGSAMAEITERLRTIELPPGYSMEVGGQRLSQIESFRALAVAVSAAAPVALAGGLLALVATRIPLNVSSLLGGILLVGLVVKNGILLLTRAREREAEGMSPKEALMEAARLRLRPILMTTLCTLFGLLPLALGIGTGAEMHRPLAVAVLGGLTLSTLGTLFAVPCLYLLLRRSRA
jgi:multidrug efflux pump subunit AcrB